MPSDNSSTVVAGTAVQFPQDGPSDGSGNIARTGASTFNLTNIGTYRVSFQASVTEAGQLVVRLNSSQLAYTVVGRATGISQIVGDLFVKTTTVNSVLEIVNPAGESTALTITPKAGGVDPVSATLTIQRVQ
jgi:hypothetical protein